MPISGGIFRPAMATSPPTIVGSLIQRNLNSVTVPAGGSTYFYAATEGGSFNIDAIDFTKDLAVSNQAGFQSVIIGHSSSSTGTFNTGGAFYPIIGGIGVTSSSYTTKSFSNNGQTTLSDSLVLASDSFVVLVSASSNNAPFHSVSLPFLLERAASTTCCSTVAFESASLSAGSYPFTVSYSACSYNCSSDISSMAIGVVMYIFS